MAHKNKLHLQFTNKSYFLFQTTIQMSKSSIQASNTCLALGATSLLVIVPMATGLSLYKYKSKSKTCDNIVYCAFHFGVVAMTMGVVGRYLF